MRARRAAIIAVLLVAAVSCGKSDADKQADCQKAITDTSTVTARPDACKDLSDEDYKALLMDYAIKKSGLGSQSNSQ